MNHKFRVTVMIAMVILALSAVIMAVPWNDFKEKYFSTLQGDLKILSLGDFKWLVNEKLGYLEKNKEIRAVWSKRAKQTQYSSGFKTDLLGHEVDCFLGYNSYGQLDNINIRFGFSTNISNYSFNRITGNTKAFVTGKLTPMLVARYGKPTHNYGFMDQAYELTNQAIVKEWVRRKKIIRLMVNVNNPEVVIFRTKK